MKIIFKSVFVFILILFCFNYNALADGDEEDKDKKVGFAIYPAASYTPETSLMFGAVAFLVFKPDQISSTNYRPTSVSPYIVYSLRNQLEVNVDFDFFLKNGMNFTIATRYYDFPDYFYGIGNDTDIENEESFTSKAFYLEGQAMKPLNENVFIGFSFDTRYDHLQDFEEDGLLQTSEITGKDGGFLWGLGPAFRFDSRDNILYPSKGSLINLNGIFYPGLLGNDYEFSLFTLDFRKYFSIVNERNILAFQFLSRLSNGDLPFYKLPRLGGSKRLRGINHANRYINNHVFYFQGEYRKELFWRFGGVIFAGFGDVAEQIGEFNANDLKVVLGIGGRFRALKDEKLNARIDFGFTLGKEQNGLYFLIREAF